MAPGSQGPAVRRFADLDALSRAAADELAAIARAAVVHRGTCSIALSGGSTPRRLFQRLAHDGRDALPWDHVELWWGDERTVPPDHADSNYRMAREALIDPLGLPASHVHRIAGELADHEAGAHAYERALVAALGSPPIFDLVLLGLGPDGHTASLFPHSPALAETTPVSSIRGARLPSRAPRWVVANPVTSPLVHGSATRITLTAPALCAARHIRFLVAGADKAAALAKVLEGERDPTRYPAQLIAPELGDLVWLVDAAAAAALRGAA